MMNAPPDPPPCRDPFDDLLDALICGDASARDIRLLNDTLRADPAARQSYIRSLTFEAMLAREFARPEESPQPRPTRRRLHRWLTPLAVAATIGTFDSWDGATTVDANRGHVLTLLAKHAPPSPTTLDGPFGLALHFHTTATSHPIPTHQGATPAAARPFTLGRYSGAGPGRDGFFEGDIDELHVFEDALLPSQITRLMKRNSLRPAKP